VALLATLAMGARHRRRANALLDRLVRRLSVRLQRVAGPIGHGILDGARGLADGPSLLGVLLFSAVLWGMIVLTYLLAFLALDIQVPLVAASLATVVIVATFVFLPQGPGFVGTWQAACVVSLALFHVPKDVAVGYSLLTWVIQLVVNVGAGAVAAAFEDLSVRQLVAVREREPAAGRG
jgi:uncharacterized membrane protein YbhN (UPF0104 family)